LCVLASLVAGCSGDAASPPTTPADVAPVTPLAPVPNHPSPGSGSFAITGIVQGVDHPIPGVNVNAWVQEAGGFGYSWWWAHGPLHADGAGRYTISGLPAGVRVWLQAFQDGYYQPCAVSLPPVHGDTTANIVLASTGVIAPVPPSSATSRSVFGTVVTSAGQPAAGAWVDFEPIMDFPAATTHTDSAGRFALCGLPVDETIWFGAVLGSSVGYVAVPPGQSEGVKIVLP